MSKKITTAERAVAYINEHPEARLTTRELADAIEVSPTNLSTALRAFAAAGGEISSEKSGLSFVWFTPAPPEPTDGALQIAIYSDGDVSVKGHTLGDDGVAMFTREQLQQLIALVTRPHLQLAAAVPHHPV